jgi:hypothetical protein
VGLEFSWNSPAHTTEFLGQFQKSRALTQQGAQGQTTQAASDAQGAPSLRFFARVGPESSPNYNALSTPISRPVQKSRALTSAGDLNIKQLAETQFPRVALYSF